MDIALLVWAIALTILVILFIVWVLDLQARIGKLQRRYQDLFSGDIEEDADVIVALTNLSTRLTEANTRTDRLVARAEQIDTTLARAVQGVGLVRYRAFQDTGGDQSFSLALTDGEGNGVVVSALYGRGATRIYAKPTQGWLSSKTLSKEEEQALAEARLSIVGQRKAQTPTEKGK